MVSHSSAHILLLAHGNYDGLAWVVFDNVSASHIYYSISVIPLGRFTVRWLTFNELELR